MGSGPLRCCPMEDTEEDGGGVGTRLTRLETKSGAIEATFGIEVGSSAAQMRLQ